MDSQSRGAGKPRRLPAGLGGPQENLWSGFGEAWSILGTLVSGVAVWGGAGYLLDRWLGTKPVLFVIGALVGNFAAIYLIYVKQFRDPPTAKRSGDRIPGGSKHAA